MLPSYDTTLSTAIDLYLEAKRAERMSKNTLIEYTRTFNRFRKHFDSDPILAEITPRDVRKFLNDLDGLSDKTVLNFHIGLSSLWTWAIAEDICDRHIPHYIKRPKPEIREVEPYTKEEVEAMLAAAERTKAYARPGKKACTNSLPSALRNKAIILVLVDTGVRSNELCELKAISYRNNSIKVFGKGKKERRLPVSSNVVHALDLYLSTERGDYSEKDATLFVTSTGQPLVVDQVYHMITHIAERAHVCSATVHRFRHTFAINFLRNGGNIYALQKALGHVSLEMVKRYLAIVDADLERVHAFASPVKAWGLKVSYPDERAGDK